MKICDFGTTRFFDARMTKGQGTPLWMSKNKKYNKIKINKK